MQPQIPKNEQHLQLCFPSCNNCFCLMQDSRLAKLHQNSCPKPFIGLSLTDLKSTKTMLVQLQKKKQFGLQVPMQPKALNQPTIE